MSKKPPKFEAWDPFQPERKRRPLLRLLVALGFAGAAAGGVLLYYASRTTPRSPALLPAETPVFAAFTPGFAALAGLPLLRRAYPGLFTWDALVQVRARCERELGVDFDADVLPWLGAEAAIALAPSTERGAAFPDDGPGADTSLLVAERDAGKARAFLAKVRAARARRGQRARAETYAGVGYDVYPGGQAMGLVGGFVVWSSTASAIDGMIDRASGKAKDTLASDDDYRQVVDRLPGDALGRIYLSGDAVGEQARAHDPMPNLGNPEAGLAALRAMAGALELRREGIRLEGVTRLDLTQMSPGVRAGLAGTRLPVDPALEGGLPATSLAAVSFRLPPGTPAGATYLVHELEKQHPELERAERASDLDLAGDLCSWLEGEVATGASTAGSGAAGWPAEGVLVMRPHDPDRAKAGLEKLRAAAMRTLAPAMPAIATVPGLSRVPGWQGLARRATPYAFEPRERDGVAWQVLHDGPGDRDLGGYGFRGDTLYVALGPDALDAAGHGPGLAGQARFKAARRSLPRPNGGELFFDLAGARGLLPPQALNAEQRRALEPLEALAAAGTPGVAARGFVRTTVTVTLSAR